MQSSVRVHRAAASSLSTTTLLLSVTMRSGSTVDGAIEAACAGDSHRAQTPVSAISRGREGGGPPPAPGAVDCRGRAECADGPFNLF